MAATNVHKIRARVSGAGGQHFAIGVMNLTDRGDLPLEYDAPHAKNPAIHVSTPVIDK